MNFRELEDFLEKYESTIEWAQIEEDIGAVYLKSNLWNTVIRVEFDKLPGISESQLIHQLEGGKNVVQMTRVTGFFSLVKNWNPGKKAELKDRFRIQKF